MNVARIPMLLVWFAVAAIGTASPIVCQEPKSKGSALSSSGGYDPLRIDSSKHAALEVKDLVVHDAERKIDLPIRVYLPASKEAQPVVLFSHGLGGSSQGNRYCGEHWSARGYVAVFLQHPGSDTSVWKDAPMGKRMQAMNDAASLQNFASRTTDVVKVLNELERWNEDPKHELAKRMDLKNVGMSGHSFGAHTTQAMGGQSFPLVGRRYYDPRIQAALAMSPSVPARGDPAQAFGKVSIPWMLMTGTKDDSPIGNTKPEDRVKVYPNLPSTIDKYQIVLHEAQHSAFTDRALPGDMGKRNPNHHKIILSFSTAFWDAYLRKDPLAREWLMGEGAASMVESQDRWEKSGFRRP